MKKTIISLFIIFFILFSSSLNATADDEFGTTSIHGFISQGYLVSDDHEFYSADTDSGTFEFNEIGINFLTTLNDNLRLGLQLLARDLGEFGNDEVTIDWAYADYRFRNWLGLRVGKVKAPNGLYNQSRDIDAARTTIFLPSGLYSENFREAQLVSKGFALYGNLPGHIEYLFVYGVFDVPLDGWIVSKVDGTQPGLKTASVKVDPGYNGALVWETPLEGLRIGATGSKYKMIHDLELLNISIPLPLDLAVEGQFVIGSIEFLYSDFIISAEYKVQRTKIYLSGNKVRDVELEDAYVMASYRFTDWFELGTYFSWHFEDRNDRNGKEAVAKGFTAFKEQGWLKDFAVTTRFDIYNSWILKLEVHVMNGLADIEYKASDPSPDATWMLYAAKLSYSF